ncbi:7836_t:CDS:1, partial [Paraglomus occultum]
TKNDGSILVPGTPGSQANEVRSNAFRDYQRILINNALDLTVDADAKKNFLQDLHKEIAIQKITNFLAFGAPVNSTTLPQRTAADVTTAGVTLALGAGNDYQDYANFIRNSTYNENNLNGFVVEIAGKISLKRCGALKVQK